MMAIKLEDSQFMEIFSILPDPRKIRNQFYSLSDLLSTAILAIICGYEDWEEVSLRLSKKDENKRYCP